MSSLDVIAGKEALPAWADTSSSSSSPAPALTEVNNEPKTWASTSPSPSSPAQPNSGANRKEKVETSCNDPLFVILFVVAVLAIAGIAFIYGVGAVNGSNSSSQDESSEYQGYILATSIIIFLSFLGAGGGMMLLFCIPQFLIKVALIFAVFMALVAMFISFANGQVFGIILGVIMFAWTACYAYMAWSRIPFATANLVTAMTAIRANLGVALYAYFFSIVAGIWALLWVLAFAGVYDQKCTANADGDIACSPNYGALFALVLPFFFVQQVLQSCIHVTVAGTTGTWWYAPDESGCCSSAINNSFLRTVTTSFGSICFGSLLVAIVQSLKAIAHAAKQNGDARILACIAECILGCLACIIEYFNKWAFVYVGIYGMPYLKAGKSVFELFENRGWSAIVADDLLGKVLLLITIMVGGLMGCVALTIEASTTMFFLGFVVGLLVTSILMSTIGSAVNAVIVLFAEAPNEFQQNHPDLSNKMRQIWAETYPGSF